MNVKANWILRLDCNCDECNQLIDLTVSNDLWARGVTPLESGTPRSKNIEVYCESCDHNFLVDLEY